MKLTLYQYPGGDGVGSVSPPCFKVELALRLLGADYALIDLTSPRRVAEISASGRLPVLRVDDRLILDSMRILDELERLLPAPWVEAPEPERIRDRLWESFVNDRVYWCGFHLRWVDPEDSARFVRALFGRMKPPARWLVPRLFVPRQRRRARLHGSGHRTRQDILDEIVHALDMAVTAIGDGPFLQGRPSPGRGDLAFASLLAQAGFRDTMPAVQREVEKRPSLVAHMRDVFSACGYSR